MPAVTPPGFLVAGKGGVGLSVTGERSFAGSVTLDILQRRLTAVLRHERGLSYSVQGFSQQLSADLAHAWLAADALPDQVSAAAHTALATLEDLAEDGCRPGEVADFARRQREAYESPDGPAIVLAQHAQNLLEGRPVRTPEEMLRRAAAVTPESVGATAGEMLSQAIIVTPQVVPAVLGRMPQLPRWSTLSVTGQRFTANSSAMSLTVGDQGVMLSLDAQQRVTVLFDRLAALLRWNDGKRALIGADGFTVRLDAADWPNGDSIMASIDAQVKPDLVVDLAGPGPASAVQELSATGQEQASPLPGAAVSGQSGTAVSAPARPGAHGASSRASTSRPAAWMSGILWTLILLCWFVGLLDWSGGTAHAWRLLVIPVASTCWRLGPRLYRAYRPAAPAPARHGWGFRVVRAVFVTWAVVGILVWSGDDPAGPGLALSGAACILGLAGVGYALRRSSART